MSDGPARNRPAMQLPFDFRHAQGFTRDHLVVSPANAAAVVLIDQWPDWPSPVMVLAGPPGSGKSHLAAIWREKAGALALDPAAPAALGDEKNATIDDADRFAVDQTGLFHAINTVRERQGALLMTARKFPSAWGVSLPDLASRLKAATVVELAEPDDALLEGVIAKLFADRQVEVEPHVIQYLVRRMERSLSTAIDLVGRLDHAALEAKSRITRALAADVMTAMDEGQGALDL